MIIIFGKSIKIPIWMLMDETNGIQTIQTDILNIGVNQIIPMVFRDRNSAEFCANQTNLNIGKITDIDTGRIPKKIRVVEACIVMSAKGMKRSETEN